jgi:hypothetical protein
MSKKLIAVASAAALALTGLVGVAPASASAPAATFTTIGSGDGSTSALAATVTVARANAIGATATGILLNIDTLATGDVVRITATGGVRLLAGLDALAGSADVDVTKAGVTEVSYTHSTAAGTSDTSLDMLAYTKSTAVGTIVVNVVRTGLTYNKTLYLKGDIVSSAEVGYNITEVTGMPSTLAANTKADITFKVTDAFGNALENNSNILNVATTQVNNANGVLPTWDSTAKVYKASVTAPTSGTFIVEIRAKSTDPSVLGLVAANWRNVSVINNTGVSAQITALTAQVTALTADYNALAAKWNKRVASKTAPKKKVVLK